VVEVNRSGPHQPGDPASTTSTSSGHLLFGEWLRSRDRLREAREWLWVAEEISAEIGMEAFAERTRGELVAVGAKPRVHPTEPRADLTPQEEQIARLARGGLTNAQIGAELFLSPRTVEWHLNRVFGKLGIDSRKCPRCLGRRRGRNRLPSVSMALPSGIDGPQRRTPATDVPTADRAR
jgi:DNA-binding CsgD family transcriptional regulator